MSCEEVIEFLMDYLAGDLTTEQCRVFEEHLGECPECVDFMNSYRMTVDLCLEISMETVEPIPDDLARAIMAARVADNASHQRVS